MNVLVACEESQIVCSAFRSLGHDAYSCDIKPCSGLHPEWHILGDVISILNPSVHSFGRFGIDFCTLDGLHHFISGSWDLIIAHPPCTYLTFAGNRHFNVSRYGDKALERFKLRSEAAEFFLHFVNADCERICIENPCGYMNSFYRPADQTIHPYFFVDDIFHPDYQMKRTCLWLKNLPKLHRVSDLPKPSPKYIKPNGKAVYFTEAVSGSGALRAELRSKTFSSVALAMASQWG